MSDPRTLFCPRCGEEVLSRMEHRVPESPGLNEAYWTCENRLEALVPVFGWVDVGGGR